MGSVTPTKDIIFPKELFPNIEESLKNAKQLKYREGDVIICSYPKSGTHWTESLIRCLRRQDDSESIVPQEGLIELTRPEKIHSMTCPRVLLTHLWPNRLPAEHVKNGGKLVLVLRNPKDLVVSAYHAINKSKIFSIKTSWTERLELFSTGRVPFGDFFTYLNKWQDALKSEFFNIECFYYEDLKENPIQSLRRLAHHVGVTKTDEELQAIVKECAIDNLRMCNSDYVPTGLFDDNNKSVIYRKGEVGDWKNHFTVAQNKWFDDLISKKMYKSMFTFRYE